MFFRVFFQDLCEFVRHCNRRYFFRFVCSFLLTITCRNETIIVELKAFFVLNGTLSPFLGVPIIEFLTITKNGAGPALAFNFIIVATNAKNDKTT